jgi:glycosyltransferase involved in cell wall biosynthesis
VPSAKRGVYEALKARPDIRPDVVVAHSGFGSSLFLPHLYDAPIVNFFEYYYHADGGAFRFRPEFPVTEADVLRSGPNNAMILLDLQRCDRGWCPNFAQRDVMPGEFHSKIEVIPEGVDTELYRRKFEIRNSKSETNPNQENPNDRNGSGARVLPDGTVVPAGTRIVTYVSRGFELMRGFDVFMEAARRTYQTFPNVLFVVAGTDRACYLSDGKLTGGVPLRRRLFETGEFDRSRFRFTGWLPEPKLVDLLSVSDLHVYLTAPFITSWSMLDAMSCSCVVLASDQACTREYIEHRRNGLLCDFFDAEGMARAAVEVLRDPGAYRAMGEAARETVEKNYSLEVCLPRIARMLEGVVARGVRVPSVRAEVLVREGKRAEWMAGPRGVGAEVGVVLLPFDGTLTYVMARGAVPLSETGPSPRPSPLSTGERGSGPRAAGGGKTVLFAWELGMGLGHLMQMAPLARDLAGAGHCVVVALRHLERAAEVFGDAGVYFLQAPYRGPSGRRAGRTAAFAQILGGLGFGDDNELFAHASAWRNLIRSVGPDLIVCDYSPTALLAARDFPEVRRAVIGSGFCVPPDDGRRPWAPLRAGLLAVNPAPALTVEAEILGRVNWVLEGWGREPLGRLGELFSDVDETFLTTFPELDHFRDRAGAAYWGPVIAGAAGESAEAPVWPTGAGKKVFVYLKRTPVADEVLRVLDALGVPTLAYVDGLDVAERKRLESPTVRVAERRVDVSAASRACDQAVVNGGHGVTVEMLLAGKPVLAVPLVLEQSLTGEALRRLGAGDAAPAKRGEPWEWAGRPKLEALLRDEEYGRCARRFAERYAAFDPQEQRRAMLGRAEALLADGSRCAEVARSTELIAV